MNPNKPWEEHWKIESNLSGGGQGSTLLVSNNSSELFVMKLLTNQKDLERRKRMRIEVLTSEALDHPNIPKLIDSNVQEYKNPDIKLFCVFDYIQGGTLSENFNKLEITIPKVVDFISSLCSTIEYCNNLGIIHRDIKPDNIILRNGELTDPVIIDFGLTFNINHSDENVTPSNQHLGNRFLLLPELRGKGSNKRDYRSDITNIIGILFYLITGEYPTNLLDENSSKPHQRKTSIDKINSLGDYKKTQLNRIFDIGFNIDINQRYQSFEAFLNDFNELIVDQKKIENVEEQLNAIYKLISDNQLKNAELLDSSSTEVGKNLRTLIGTVAKELPTFTMYQTGYTINYEKLEHRTTYGLRNKIKGSIGIECDFRTYFSGSEEIIDVQIGSKTIEIARRQIGRLFNWIRISKNLRDLIISTIYNQNSS